MRFYVMSLRRSMATISLVIKIAMVTAALATALVVVKATPSAGLERSDDDDDRTCLEDKMMTSLRKRLNDALNDDVRMAGGEAGDWKSPGEGKLEKRVERWRSGFSSRRNDVYGVGGRFGRSGSP